MEVLPLTAVLLQRRAAVQRRMSRNIAGWGRVEGEPWDGTVRLMRARLAAALRQFFVEDWSHGVCQRRLDQAWHIAHNPTSWPSRTTAWNPATFFDPAAVTMPCRGRGRPLARWDDTTIGSSPSPCRIFNRSRRQKPRQDARRRAGGIIGTIMCDTAWQEPLSSGVRGILEFVIWIWWAHWGATCCVLVAT